MTSKDAKYFNVSEKHEMDQVCKKYEDPQAVREFIKAKAQEGVIKYWTHERLAEYLAENGYEPAPKGGRLTMDELNTKIADKCGISKADADKVVKAFASALEEALTAGESITLQGFGVFKVTMQAPRKGRNPQTGVEIEIPARKVVKFTPASAFKDAVAGKQA